MRRSTGYVALVGMGAMVVVVGGMVGLFLVDDPGEPPAPVAFEDTVQLGPSLEGAGIRGEPTTIPRAQVFYSQYQYVVGYTGLEALLDALQSDHLHEQLGFPLEIYVSDFAEVDLDRSPDGYLIGDGIPDWKPATELLYVTGSQAETIAGPTIVPFGSAESASAFVAEYGGTINTWDEIRAIRIETDPLGTVVNSTAHRSTDGMDASPTEVETDQRPVSIVVGQDEETLAAAVERAPPETTVVLPTGTYAGPVTIESPITIAGTDAEIVGNETGSVVHVRAANVSIEGVRISGTGNETRRDVDETEPPDRSDLDTRIEHGYGHADSAIEGEEAPNLTVSNVSLDTRASGVLVRDSPGLVVRSVVIHGPPDWRDGFMGIVAMRSPVTVEDSSFRGGRDGIYLHQADGSVIHRNSFDGNRYGVHLMYSDGVRISDNRIRNATFGGITVMTRPTGTTIVGNDIRSSANGIQTGGTNAYVACNVLVDNGLGFSASARQSVYERNVLVGNDVGVRATTVIPSSHVFANDFVANTEHAGAGAGPLRVWTHDDTGNYWDGAYGDVRGTVLDRAYAPTDPVDGILHHETSARVIADSPLAWGLDRLAGTVPGMRTGSIIDTAPLDQPVHREVVRILRDDPTASVTLDCDTGGDIDEMIEIQQGDDTVTERRSTDNRPEIASTS